MCSILYSYVTKVFAGCTAVKEVHMEIEKNQLFTLLGPVALCGAVNPRTAVAKQPRSIC